MWYARGLGTLGATVPAVGVRGGARRTLYDAGDCTQVSCVCKANALPSELSIAPAPGTCLFTALQRLPAQRPWELQPRVGWADWVGRAGLVTHAATPAVPQADRELHHDASPCQRSFWPQENETFGPSGL